MKITSATLIAILALGSSMTFAQNSNLKPGTVVTTSGNATVTVTTVMRPLTKNESEQFHADRAASFSSMLQTTIPSRQLDAMPLKDGNPLNALAGR